MRTRQQSRAGMARATSAASLDQDDRERVVQDSEERDREEEDVDDEGHEENDEEDDEVNDDEEEEGFFLSSLLSGCGANYERECLASPRVLAACPFGTSSRRPNFDLPDKLHPPLRDAPRHCAA
jgi:hypothetical protein